MSSGQLTAIIIVAIVMVASIVRAGVRPGSRRHLSGGDNQAQAQILAENQRLREEVTGLKDRLHVLERIAVDKENSLANEIESLRDR
jgi:hypothetical protein